MIQVKCRGPGSIPLTGEKELGLNSMKRYLCRAAIAGVAGIFLLLSFVSCGRAGYQYNNLISEEDMPEYRIGMRRQCWNMWAFILAALFRKKLW